MERFRAAARLDFDLDARRAGRGGEALSDGVGGLLRALERERFLDRLRSPFLPRLLGRSELLLEGLRAMAPRVGI